ncbi:hypothetical protein VDS44_13535, partial [Xanthomonas campestris pv. campestris]|nr:hypothetical protein [Xanthomonas campestris pv. campestris]
NKPTTQYPSTPGFISNHWYGRWGQVTLMANRLASIVAVSELNDSTLKMTDMNTGDAIANRSRNLWPTAVTKWDAAKEQTQQ